MATTLLESVIHYRKKLDRNPDDEVILNVIHKLSKIPITLEILEATHIGKYIRKLSKRHDLVGSKAKVVLNKWRDIFANSVSDKNSKSHSVSKKENVNKSMTSSKHLYMSEDKTVNNHKETSHEHKHKHKNSLYSNASEQSSKKQLNGTNHASENDSIEPSLSLYNYEGKKETSLKYKDYDPHAEVSEGYNPECPEFFPSESKTVKPKKVSLDTYEPSLKRKHSKVSDESDSENGSKSHSKKLKHTNYSISDLDSFTESKYVEKKDKQNSHKEKSTNRTSSSHSMNGKQSSDVKSDKNHCSKHKSSSSSSSDSKKAKSKGSGDSASEKGNKLIKKTKKVPMHSSEEFTSSDVSFEACLGFNDIVSLKKKKNLPSKLHTPPPPSSSSSSSSSTKKSSVNESKKSVKKDSSSVPKVKAHKESSHKDKDKHVFEAPMPPKIKLQVSDITSTLPEIQPNYRPLPRSLDFYSPKKKEVLSNEEAIMFTSSRREKTAVYSGRKNYFFTEVPTLVNCCTRILIENIDDIECVGDLPYHLFRPILEKCTPLQLMNIENFNPHLIDETNEFWEIHCKRDYKLLAPLEHETWRDLYLRASDERERKLKSITASISANISKSNPVRQVKLAYVDSTAKPPRDVARKQAKNGTAVPVCVPVKVGPPSKSTPRPTAPVINSANSSSVERPSFINKKPKVAPLMAKTLKSMKQCFRRK